MRSLILYPVIACAALAGAAEAAEHVVSQKNRAFVVGSVDAKVGDEVLFKNEDGVFHNIFSLSEGLSFDLGAYGPGLAKKLKLDKPGKIEVECSIHPRMKMVIDVTK